MKDIVVKVVKLDKLPEFDIGLPQYQTSGSAGCDVPSADTLVIEPGTKALVSTGLSMEIPEGFECQIRSRSSLALKHEVVVFNSPATIDCDYRGEIRILLFNTSKVPFLINVGDRIAQFVFAPVVKAMFEQTHELNDSSRGAGGWGSTGVR